MPPPLLSDAPTALIARALDGLKRERPRVHVLTNSVVQHLTADMLLAANAVPTMTGAADEVGGFLALADALAVNLGTLDAHRRDGITVALGALGETPWVLDPAHCEASPSRLAFARALIGRGPAVLRLNAREYESLFGTVAPVVTARNLGLVVALTGRRDVVASAEGALILSNGHSMLDRMTGAGCAGTAVIAACLALKLRPAEAAIAGLSIVNIAAERAAETANGPGTFAAAWLDEVYALVEGDARGAVAARLAVSG